MARPKTKDELLQAGKDNFKQLFDIINSMTIEEQRKNFVFEDRDKNIKDVLVHLFEWHVLLLNWINSNQSGKKANFLPEPYNWKTYSEMNIKFWEKHKDTPYEESIKLVNQSHLEVLQIINNFSNEELFTNKYFDWTGSTSLGSYCVSATSSHYDWAIKKIRKHKKSL